MPVVGTPDLFDPATIDAGKAWWVLTWVLTASAPVLLMAPRAGVTVSTPAPLTGATAGRRGLERRPEAFVVFIPFRALLVHAPIACRGVPARGAAVLPVPRALGRRHGRPRQVVPPLRLAAGRAGIRDHDHGSGRSRHGEPADEFGGTVHDARL